MESVETRSFSYDHKEYWRHYLERIYRSWLGIICLALVFGGILGMFIMGETRNWVAILALASFMAFFPWLIAKDLWKRHDAAKACERRYTFRFTPTTVEYENDAELRVRVPYSRMASVKGTGDWVTIQFRTREGELRIPRSSFRSEEDRKTALGWISAGITSS